MNCRLGIQLALAAALLGSAGTALAHPPAGHVAIKAGRTFDGHEWLDDAVVVLHGRSVQSIRRDGSAPAGMEVIDAPQAVVTPGLIDLDSALGLGKHRDEWQEALSPDLHVIDGFRPDEAELAELRRSGVTTAWLSAGRLGVLSGCGALVQASPAGRNATILNDTWGHTGSVAAGSRIGNREPTSLAGQVRLLRPALATPAVDGPTRLVFDDTGSALAAKSLGGILVGLPRVGPGLQELSGGRGLIVTGLAPWHGNEETSALLELQGELPLGFGSNTAPMGPGWIRMAAARSVSAGLSPRDALVALTSGAAAIAELPGQRGTLTAGAVADVVLWTADPTHPSARALRVWVGGEEVLK